MNKELITSKQKENAEIQRKIMELNKRELQQRLDNLDTILARLEQDVQGCLDVQHKIKDLVAQMIPGIVIRHPVV